MDWREFAACLGVDPEVFFPAAESGPVFDREVAEAKAVCAVCPVRDECLAEALVTPVEGVWGGTTEQERRALRRAGARKGA